MNCCTFEYQLGLRDPQTIIVLPKDAGVIDAQVQVVLVLQDIGEGASARVAGQLEGIAAQLPVRGSLCRCALQ